ncbi:MAG: sensor histidine kinase [bacterium]
MEALLCLSILFQLIAGIFAIKLIRITGTYKAWVIMIAVIFMMMARRIITLKDVMTGKIDGNNITESEIVALIISISLSTALYLMMPIFRTYRNNELQLKRKNKAFKKAKKQAEEANALKTAFLHNIRHELRTPMNAIVGFADLLNTPDLPQEENRYYSNIVINSSHQLLAIVDDILTIASIDTGKEKMQKREVNVNALISELIDIHAQQTSNIPVTLKKGHMLPDEEARIWTDPNKLTQVLSNLLSNAIKFSQNGNGNGIVETGYTKPDDNSLKFYVKDNGIGIDKAKQKAIFERFVQAEETTSATYGGTGLGLSICKGFVELLGGSIWVESEPGKGATFYFSIRPADSQNK